MNRQQAERKAMELYPDNYPARSQRAINEEKRAAFMQCFDLMPTGSLPMTREDAKEWAKKRFPSVLIGPDMWMVLAKRMAVTDFYDHLASLSSAAPAPASEAEPGMPLDPLDLLRWAMCMSEPKSEDTKYTDHLQLVDGLFFWSTDNEGDQPLEAEDMLKLYLKDDDWVKESAAPAPVGVTRDSVIEWIQWNWNRHDQWTERASALAMFDYLQGTAPVSSAAQPATNWEKELELALTTVTRLAKEKRELKEELAAKPATGYSEAQVREAIRLAHQLNGYRAIKFTPDEIISSLNQKP